MPMTSEEFKAVLPIQLKNSVTQDVMDSINQVLSGPESTEIFKENLLSYTRVLLEGKFKMTSYVNAVRYVSFKLLGGTNKAAFTATFPDKISRWNAQGVSEKDQSSYISAYHKSKLVNLIMEQTLIPLHVLNAPIRQEAVNTLADLMRNASSEKVRSDSAAHILRELKPPEKTKIELDLGAKADKTLDTLRETTRVLVEQQKAMIAQGVPIKTIAEGVLVVKE